MQALLHCISLRSRKLAITEHFTAFMLEGLARLLIFNTSPTIIAAIANRGTTLNKEHV